MDTLTDALIARLNTILDSDNLPEIRFIGLHNSQKQYMENGEDYSFDMPALFIEYVNTMEIGSVGGGVQVYEPLDVNFHLFQKRLNTEGELERNRDIKPLVKKIHAKIYKWKTDGSGYFDRVGMDLDYDHTNVHETILRYRSSWVDVDLAEPIGGEEKAPPFTTDITGQIVDEIG